MVRHISQGPYHNAVGAQPGGAAPAAGLSDHRAGKAKRLATVVLMTAGPQKILTIKTIREITGADLKTAKDMVDNVPGRAGPRPVTTGHNGGTITNRFGYDEFLRVAESLGAEPLLVVNLRDELEPILQMRRLMPVLKQ